MKILEGEYEMNEDGETSYIVHNTCLSPVFFISERDCVDKRIEIMQDGIYYNFSSSISEDVSNFI
jgi:hypothetical protein